MKDVLYSIEVDLAQRAVRVAVRGFWNVSTVPQFKKDVEAAYKGTKEGGRVAHALILIDARGMQAQSQAVITALQEFFAEERAEVAKSAILLDSMLLKRQVQRATEIEDSSLVMKAKP